MTDKKALRQLIRMRKQQHAASDSAPVTDKLLRHPRLQRSHTILLYSALPDEVETQPLLDALADGGKTVLLPRVVSLTDMELRYYTGQHDLQPGAFGIMEPVGTLFTDFNSLELAVVPGMAFDTEGHRLGRGRGYYDRFLSRVPHVYKIGICFPWQLLEHIPVDANDVNMDSIVF